MKRKKARRRVRRRIRRERKSRWTRAKGEEQARQPKSKMQIHSTNHYRWQASLLLKKRKEKPVDGPPARGFEGSSRFPEGEFTPHAVNACWCVLPRSLFATLSLCVAIRRQPITRSEQCLFYHWKSENSRLTKNCKFINCNESREINTIKFTLKVDRETGAEDLLGFATCLWRIRT